MALVQQMPAATPTADVVGNAFVLQYYNILEQSPELVHRFYQDISKLGRPGDDGIMGITTTMDEINKKILDYGELSANIVTVDAQESFNGGVLVLVTGYLTGKDNLKKKFTQSFFLAPQDVGYFVLNDVFRYVDDSASQGGDSGLVVDVDVEAHLTSDDEFTALKDNHVPEPVNEVTEDFVKEEAYNPTVNGEVSIEEEEAPVPEVINEIPDDLHEVADNAEVEAESYSKVEAVSYSKVEAESYPKVEAESNPKVEAESNPRVEAESNPKVEAEFNPKVEAVPNPKVEAVPNPKVVTESNSKVEVQKKSYASILKTANAGNLPFSTPTPVRSVPKKPEHQAIVAPTPVPASETAVSSTNARENGNLEPEAEGHSIYIKGLPMNCTNSLIENEFKKFGQIKHNGLQVRLLRGFCFGFVEYDAASAVKAAIEASPIVVGGQRVFVEEKRSTRGNNRSRFSSGRGNGNGYRNEGGSGYRNEGGSGYRNEGGSGYRNEGGNGYKTEGGNSYRTEGGNGYRTEGGRGRGGYGGGRSYGRGDFNSKSEFGGRSSNRGGSSSRGGDGYQRSDHGSRGNRAVNAAARSTAPQVSASA